MISTSANQVVGLVSTIPTVSFTEALAASPDGRFLFVAGATDDDSELLILSQSNYALEREVAIPNKSIGYNPFLLIVSPDSSTLYIFVYSPSEDSNELVAYSVASGTFSPAIGLKGGSLTSALSPDGTELYYVSSHTIWAVNTSTFSQSTVESPVKPVGVAVTPDNSQLIVTSTGDSIGVVDLANTANSSSIPVGAGTGAILLN